MDDNENKGSWDSLIEDLGVTPDQTAFERHQPESQELPPAAEPIAAETPAPQPSDWNSLAESLGLEADEKPTQVEPPAADKPVAKAPQEKTKPTAKAKPPKSDSFGGFLAEEVAEDDLPETAEVAEVDQEDELPPLPSQIDQALSDSSWEADSEEDSNTTQAESDEVDSDGITGDAARSAFDALFSDGASGWGSAFLAPKKSDEASTTAKPAFKDELDPLSSDKNEEATTEGGEEEAERPKRKRSRRRRRGGRGRKPAGERTGDAAESTETSDELETGVNSEDSKEEKKKPRRRRSRNRKRRSETAEDEAVRDEKLTSSDPDNDSDDDLEDELDQPRAASRGRTKHRNIPTWSDAIGMIVDANLDQRAKSPSKPQSSSRGRGGRGGRRRRKPESK